MIGIGELMFLQMATLIQAARVFYDGYRPGPDQIRQNDQTRLEKQRYASLHCAESLLFDAVLSATR